MASSSWILRTGSGSWSTSADWAPAPPASGGNVTIGNAFDTGNVLVTQNTSIAISKLTLSGSLFGGFTTTLTLTPGSTLSVAGAIQFDTRSIINGTGTLVANGAITGGIIAASSGQLTLSGTGRIASGAGTALSVGSVVPSTLDLNLSGGVTAGVIAINSANQTLEIGPAGALTINGVESISNGLIQLAGGKLTDASGLVVGAGATLKGTGTVTAALAGTGIIEASGGALDLARALSAGPSYRIDTVAGSTLKLDAAAADGSTFTFQGAVGTLELANVTGGTVRNFNGSIAGLSVSASATVPTNEVNIQATVTKATLSGSQITVLDGTTTVATLHLSSAPSVGAYAAIRADTALGGYDVFLTNASNAAPAVTWSPGTETGAEGGVIALGTLAPSGGNPLTSVLVSGIPVGAKLADGTHSFTAATGSTSVNVLGWNYAGLTITPAGDANFTLSAQVTDSAHNVSTVVTEAVTVTPLAPTVAPVAVTGSAGQPIALNLGIAAAGLAGDANRLSSVTIGGIPAGATLSNTNHDTLSPVNGSLTLSATQLAAGALNGLSITPTASGPFNLSVAATEQDAEGNLSAATTGAESVTANGAAPAVTWSPGTETGAEGGVIALGTLAPSGGNPLTSVLVSGIPVGAKLADGTHSFTAATGSTSVNVLGWNYAGLTITPAGDANFTLSAQVTDSAHNVSTVVTEAVTVTPLAPTVAPVAVTGSAGQPIALNLGIAAAGLAGDANRLSSVTIGGIPAGATLSNTNHDTLSPVNGSLTLSATQLAAGALNGLSITPTASGPFNLSVAATEQDAEGNLSAATTGAESVTANGAATNGVPAYSHIVVVVEENKDNSEIIGDTADAPYINSLAASGANLTNYYAITHPSQPNYFALYAGSTFGTTDDLQHSETGPTLATILQGAGKSFTGYVETPDSDFNHNPWESFPEGTSVESNFSTFPSSDFASLPTVSFVIPDVNDDMHNGTIAQGDAWLQTNLSAYAQWAQANNSLLVVTWDEGDDNPTNQIPTVLYGAGVVAGNYDTAYNHYDLLSTILDASGLTAPNNAAGATPIQVFGNSTTGPGRTISTAITGPVVLAPADNPLTITSTGSVTSTGASADGVDGPIGTDWTISNAGSVSSSSGVGLSLGGNGSVTNTGQISGNEGVKILGGGSVSNAAGGSISATGAAGGGTLVGAGVYIRGTSVNVTNAGSVSGGAYGVALQGSGTVTNTATVAGGEDGVIIKGGVGQVSNSGTITASIDDGVALFAGGSITNNAGGSVSGHSTGAAIYITGGTGTVTNDGSLPGNDIEAILIESGGSVVNDSTGTISAVNTGVFFKVQSGTVINRGQITGTGTQGTGVYLENSGSVSNAQGASITGARFGAFLEGGAGTLANYGAISGGSYDGVVLGLGGSVTNAAGASILGGSGGVYAKYRAAATVTNSGTIGTTGVHGAGIDLSDGGTVTNNLGGSVAGADHGVFVLNGAGTVNNQGSISGNRYHGVHLGAGGSAINAAGASISGGSSGVYIGAVPNGTVTNSGVITTTSASGAGTDLQDGGSVGNAAGASI